MPVAYPPTTFQTSARLLLSHFEKKQAAVASRATTFKILPPVDSRAITLLKNPSPTGGAGVGRHISTASFFQSDPLKDGVGRRVTDPEFMDGGAEV